MPLATDRQTGHLRQIAAKAAYVETTRKNLARSRAQLDRTRAAIRTAAARGSVDSSDQLDRAQQVAEMEFALTESRLARLRKSGEEDWFTLREGLDDSWENLSRSLRNLVKRISDGD